MGPLDRANLNHWTDKPEEEVIDSSSTVRTLSMRGSGKLADKNYYIEAIFVKQNYISFI
jgi:hypothetical protein